MHFVKYQMRLRDRTLKWRNHQGGQYVFVITIALYSNLSVEPQPTVSNEYEPLMQIRK